MTNKEKLNAATSLMEKQALFDFGHKRRTNEWLENMKGPIDTGSGWGTALGTAGGFAGGLRLLGRKSEDGTPWKHGWNRFSKSVSHGMEPIFHPIASSKRLGGDLKGTSGALGKAKVIGGRIKPLWPSILAWNLMANAGGSVGGTAGGLTGAGVGYNKYGKPPEKRFIGF